MLHLKQFSDLFPHILLVRARPIDSLTLRASEEFFVLMKDEIRNLPFNLLSGDWIEKGVTEEASGENVLLIDLDVSSLNEPFQLERGIILWDLKDVVLRSSWKEFGVSSQNHPPFLTSPPNQCISIFTAIIDCVISQHSQFLSQFSEHTVDQELHLPRLSPLSIAPACPAYRLPAGRQGRQARGRGEGWDWGD
jgi:hypothetical protein